MDYDAYADLFGDYEEDGLASVQLPEEGSNVTEIQPPSGPSTTLQSSLTASPSTVDPFKDLFGGYDYDYGVAQEPEYLTEGSNVTEIQPPTDPSTTPPSGLTAKSSTVDPFKDLFGDYDYDYGVTQEPEYLPEGSNVPEIESPPGPSKPPPSGLTAKPSTVDPLKDLFGGYDYDYGVAQEPQDLPEESDVPDMQPPPSPSKPPPSSFTASPSTADPFKELFGGYDYYGEAQEPQYQPEGSDVPDMQPSPSPSKPPPSSLTASSSTVDPFKDLFGSYAYDYGVAQEPQYMPEEGSDVPNPSTPGPSKPPPSSLTASPSTADLFKDLFGGYDYYGEAQEPQYLPEGSNVPEIKSPSSSTVPPSDLAATPRNDIVDRTTTVDWLKLLSAFDATTSPLTAAPPSDSGMTTTVDGLKVNVVDATTSWMNLLQPKSMAQEAIDVPDIEPQPRPLTAAPSDPAANDIVKATKAGMTATFDWLKVNGTNTTASWMNINTDTNVTDYNITGVSASQEGKANITFQTTMILIPECVIVLLFAVCVLTLGVMRCKMGKREEVVKNTPMNTDDLDFYQKVYKMRSWRRIDDYTDAYPSWLPQEMPPFDGYFDADKPDKYIPVPKSDINTIPGYFEVLRVQLHPRRSTLPQNLRPVHSSPDTVYRTHWEEPLGRQLNITTSSPDILVGLWNRYRSEIFRQQNENRNLCPIHADIQSMMSGNTTGPDGRASPSAYGGRSRAFKCNIQSSTAIIPRKMTCRFCREQAMGTRTPLTSSKPLRKRCLSHSSILESGVAAMTEEYATSSTRAWRSLGPVKIELLNKTKIGRIAPQEQSYPTRGQDIKAAKPPGDRRRQSCKPEVQLGAFKTVLLNNSSDLESKSAATMASVSSSFFTSGKYCGLPSAESSNQSDLHKASIKSIQGNHSSKQLRNGHSMFLSKSDHHATTASRRNTANAIDIIPKSFSDGLFRSRQKLSDPGVDHPNQAACSRVGQRSSEAECGNDDGTCDNPICKVHSICNSVVGTLATPSNEDLESNQYPGNTSSGNKMTWSLLEDSCSRKCCTRKSASLLKSIRSAKSARSKQYPGNTSSENKMTWSLLEDSCSRKCCTRKSASLPKFNSSAKSARSKLYPGKTSSRNKMTWSLLEDSCSRKCCTKKSATRAKSNTSAKAKSSDSVKPASLGQAGTLAKSASLAKSRSSTTSYQSNPVVPAKSSSGNLVKWCFKKSKSSKTTGTAYEPPEDGLRSTPELPAPPELPDDDQQSVLPVGVQVGGYILLPSYYGADSEIDSTDSEADLAWLEPF